LTIIDPLAHTRYAVVFNVDVVAVSPMRTQPSNSALWINENTLIDAAGALAVTYPDGFVVSN